MTSRSLRRPTSSATVTRAITPWPHIVLQPSLCMNRTPASPSGVTGSVGIAPYMSACPRGSNTRARRRPSRRSFAKRRFSRIVAPGIGSRPPVTTRSGSPAACDSTVSTRRHEGGGCQAWAWRISPIWPSAPDSDLANTCSVSDDLRLRAIAAAGPSDEVVSIEPAEAEMREMHRSDLDALKDGAAMLTQAGNRVAALAVMWSAVAIAPTDLGAHRRLAAMLANAGDIDGAANEYARYIEFMLPIGDLGRATMELTYGAKVLGPHPALHDAAEKIVIAVRALAPGDVVARAPTLPMPRLLPKVPFRFCIHDDGDRHWMQLEGGTTELIPSAVRMLDRNDEVIETRKFIPLAPGQKGHAKIIEGEPNGVAWVVLGVTDEVVAALDAGKPSPYRVEAKVGEEWISTVLVDTGCRIGRRSKVAVS